MHPRSEEKVKAVLLTAVVADMEQSKTRACGNLANVHFVSLQNAWEVFCSAHPPLPRPLHHHSSGWQDTSEDVVSILDRQRFTVLSPSGSDLISLQDYSDSSMQICFIC